MSKWEALAIISEKLKHIQKEFAKCKQIADAHGVKFSVDVPSIPDGGKTFFYYPLGFHKRGDGGDWKNGRWVSSSEEC